MPNTPNKRFSIIIPVYKTEQYLDKCLAALFDQDYRWFEIIVVINKNNEKFIKKYKKNKGIRLVTIDEDRGAPYARNKGFEVSTGDYIVYVDPDVYLNPGILSVWAEAFRKNPEAGFVYTSYEIITSQGEQPVIIAGRPFDYYRLTCNNFISGGNPFKREWHTPQDESLKSLQDWDMWLTMCEKGAKGYFVEEYIGFKTERPSKGSISWDSASHWIERRTTVREKHGIKDRDIAVISMGAPLHALNVAKILGADMYDTPIHKENNYKLVYLLGFYPDATYAHMEALKQNVNEDCKKIIHWIGTDVWQMHHHVSWAGLKDLKKLWEELKVKHWTEFKPTHDEMLELGIESEIVPLPTAKLYDPVALPEEFSVGVYINDTQNMYFEDHMYDIARAMPDIKFKFFGSKTKKDHKEENKEWVGFVDMDEFINNTSCLLRITVHDGLPLGPIEFLMKGRDVVTNVPLDYAYIINEKEGEMAKAQILKSIRDIKERATVNVKASEHYRDLMNHDKFKEKVYGEK